MADLLQLPAGIYRGRVDGAESGSCEARIEVRRIPGGCVTVDYEAVGADGLQHVEHTVVTVGALHVAHSEAPGVQVFEETSPGVYDAPSGGPYAQRVCPTWDGVELTWAWHWSPAGEDPVEQSRAVTSAAPHRSDGPDGLRPVARRAGSD